MSFNPAITHPASLADAYSMSPIFDMPERVLKIMQKYKSNFKGLEQAGICFTTEQLLKLDDGQLDAFIGNSNNFKEYARAHINISSDLLCTYSGRLIFTIGLTHYELIPFIQSGYEFPWSELHLYNEEVICAIIYNGKDLADLKAIGIEFTWKELTSFSPKKIKLIGLKGREFCELYNAGITFSKEHYIDLSEPQKRLIGIEKTQILTLRKAGVPISWSQIISLDHTQIRHLDNNTLKLEALREAGLSITWDLLIGEIKIPKKTRTEKV